MSGPAGRGGNGSASVPTWDELAVAGPRLVDTMRRYLTQIGCVLRPGSVANTDQALRCFAAFLTQTDRPSPTSGRSAGRTSRPTSRGWPPAPASTPRG